MDASEVVAKNGKPTREVDPAYSDQSRDRDVEDLTNVWIIHPSSRALLNVAVRRGISANAVSLTGFFIGALAAACYTGWADWRLATVGFLLSSAWLIADGLDGMIARATKTASQTGRILDGLCDHGVFALLYIALAFSLGTFEAWLLGAIAALVHAVQSSLYEGERIRYHRRLRGDGSASPPLPRGNALLRAYNFFANSLNEAGAPLDRRLKECSHKGAIIAFYRRAASRPMKLMSLLSANVRIIMIYASCLAGDPRLFWWFEIIPLSGVALAGILWHRHAERLSARASSG